MKKRVLIIVLFFLSLNAISQNKKFSVDVNYPLSIDNSEYSKTTGVVGGSFKYRFAETKAVRFGTSYTFDTFNEKTGISFNDLKKHYFHHVDVFGEFNLNGNSKLHPFIGIGYTAIYEDYIYKIDNSFFNAPSTEGRSKDRKNGLNFNLGMSYDITNRFFVQTYFHFVKAFLKTDEYYYNQPKAINYNQIKLGAGFRF
jgi:hypothetical protein